MSSCDTKARSADTIAPAGTVAQVVRAFLRLGLSSFGGPIAHLGYFHREFVVRRAWLDQWHYAQLLAPCQFLPGPASTQFGFSVGLMRAGWAGALAAFLAFTVPSALLMFAFSIFSSMLTGLYGHAALHGLKLMAVAVVAQGVLAMGRTLTPDWPRILLAVASFLWLLAVPAAASQLAVIAFGAIISLVAIFLPGLLMISGVLPFWNRLAANARVARSMTGINAVVVGLLAAALYDPLWTSAVLSPIDFAIALAGLLALLARAPALAVIAGCIAARLAAAGLGW
jgi:chromate transport protein ChrA